MIKHGAQFQKFIYYMLCTYHFQTYYIPQKILDKFGLVHFSEPCNLNFITGTCFCIIQR